MKDIIPPQLHTPQKEIRVPGSSLLMRTIRGFGATERTLFAIFAIIAGLLALYMLWSVNSSLMVAVPAKGGELVEGVVGIPRFVNPILALTDTDRDLTSLVYAGLVKYENGNIVPDLARDFTISEDGISYTFTLRENARFHDGTPVTADDIEFTIKKAQDPALKSPRRAAWEGITVEKLSDRQVKFTLKQPYAPFLDNATIGILPKHIWQNVEGSDQFTFSQYNVEPIGAGPYKVSEIGRDKGGLPQFYILDSNNKYTGGAPYISQIVVRFYPNEKSLIEGYERGEVEAIHGISPKEAETIVDERGNNVTAVRTALPRIFGVFFNQSQAPVLANKEVRRALNIAVDRNRIVQDVLNGYGVPTDSPLPVGISGTSTDVLNFSNGSSTDRIVEAQSILEKAGWTKDTDGVYIKKGKTSSQVLRFSIATANAPELKRAAEIIQEEWRAMGADVSLQIYESGDLSQNIIRPRKFDALLFGEVIGRDLDLYGLWHSSQRNGAGLNIAMYVNSRADRLLEEARVVNDMTVRVQKYQEFESIVREDLPAIFLYSPEFIYLTPKKLKGVTQGDITIAADRLNSINKWYVNTDNVWKIFVADEAEQAL